MKRRFFVEASTLALVTGVLILTSCQPRKREFLSIQTFTRVCRTETKRWLARAKFVLACHERPCGWRGVRPIEKLWATWAAVRQKLGFTFITRPTRTIRHTGRGAPVLTSAIPSTIRSMTRPSHQAFLILARWSLSPMAGLCRFSTWHRIRAG